MGLRRALLLPLLVVACLAGPAVGAAAAACDSFTNMAGGAWGTGSNWSTGNVPQATDAVCIDIPLTSIVMLGSYDTAAGDTVASVTITSGTLWVAGQAGISGSNETTNQTTLGVTGAVTVAHGAALFLVATDGGTPTPGGAAGGGALLSAGSVVNDGTFQSSVDGVPWSNTMHVSSFTSAADGYFFVAGGTLTVSQGNPFSWTATNAGLLDVSPGSALDLTTSFAGSGAFTDTGVIYNDGSISSSSASGSASWTQAFGGLAGNPVTIGARSTLIDTAGSGAFVLGNGSTITGTISGGQTVTVEGAGGQTGTQVSLGNATLVNAGSLVLDVPGSGTASGGSVNLTNGSIQNTAAGTITAQVEDPAWRVLFQVGLANAGTLNVTGGTFDQNGAATTNAGTVSLAPSGIFELEEGASFTNAATGTIVAQLAGPTSFGQFQTSSACCAGAGTIVAGGTLTPSPIGGYLPAAGAVFPLFALSGPFSGTFATVAPGFTADYSHATASPASVGVVYGATPAPPANTNVTSSAPHVATAVGGKGVVTVRLSCSPGSGDAVGCPIVIVKATVVERLRGKKLLSVVARAPKKQAHITLKTVVIASGTASLTTGGSKTLTLKVNAAARALLVRYPKLSSLLTITSGKQVLRSSTVTVQRAAKAKAKKKT
jgi:hypothetical protein